LTALLRTRNQQLVQDGHSFPEKKPFKYFTTVGSTYMHASYKHTPLICTMCI